MHVKFKNSKKILNKSMVIYEGEDKLMVYLVNKLKR